MTAGAMQAHPAGEDEARAAISHGQSGMPTAMVGMLLFIASEVMFFGGLFATYFNARATTVGEWGPPAGGELDIALAGVLTAILVASSFTMQPFSGAMPPSYFASTLSMQPAVFGSVGLPGSCAFWWHLRSPPSFFATHFCLPTPHFDWSDGS